MSKIYIDSSIDSVRQLHGSLLATPYTELTILERLKQQADAVLTGHEQGNQAVAFHLGCWCSDFIGLSPEAILASEVTEAHAQQTIAAEHGFESWTTVMDMDESTLDAQFELAVDAVINGDVTELARRLTESPEIIRQRSQYGHAATLLHYLGANGVESYRQITPLNAVEVAELLIACGTDVNSIANMYGGSTTLALVQTSAHPHQAGVAFELIHTLKAAGANE